MRKLMTILFAGAAFGAMPLMDARAQSTQDTVGRALQGLTGGNQDQQRSGYREDDRRRDDSGYRDDDRRRDDRSTSRGSSRDGARDGDGRRSADAERRLDEQQRRLDDERRRLDRDRR